MMKQRSKNDQTTTRKVVETNNKEKPTKRYRNQEDYIVNIYIESKETIKRPPENLQENNNNKEKREKKKD